MARYLIATHTAVQSHDWLCKHCHAFGHVTVNARGESKVRVWLSEGKAGDGAHEGAAIALEQDANRIRALVRCPSCRRRAPNAAIGTLWHGLPDLGTALLTGFGALLVSAVADLSITMAFGVGIAVAIVMLLLGNERRRWREARRAQVRLASRPARKSTPPPAITARPVAPDDGPFRSPPAPPPIVTVNAPAPVTQTPIVERGESSEQPSFLR